MVFWDVMTYTLVDSDKHFGATWCLSSVSKLEAQVPPKCCHLSTKLHNATLLKTLSCYLQLWKLQAS